MFPRGQQRKANCANRICARCCLIPQPDEYRWNRDVPLLATSLVATGNAVFISGPPDLFSPIGEGEAALELVDVKAALGAWRGENGGILFAVDAGNGKELTRIKLNSPTVFDGMAAANRCLFLSLQNGTVTCLSE